MSWFGRNKPPELERAAAARESIVKQGDPRPVVLHTLDKVEAAIEVGLEDRTHIDELLAGFDEQRITAELKGALRAKSDPAAPDPPVLVSLRKRHEALHAMKNRRAEIDQSIERALVDLETLVAHTAMSRVAASDHALDDLTHWLDQLDADARALAAAHDVLTRLEES